MNKKFSRVLAVLLALMMLVSSAPVGIVASAVDMDPADFLTFNVTSGGNVSVGTQVIIYSGSTELTRGTTNIYGVVEFITLSDSDLSTATEAVVGGHSVYGPFQRAVYYVDLTDRVEHLENPQLMTDGPYFMQYGETKNLNVSTVSDAVITYEVVSGEGVVVVDSDGNATAIGVGEAVIKAYVNSTDAYAAASTEVKINVAAADNAIVGFAIGDIPNANPGSRYNNAAILAEGASGSIKYSSNNEDFASVDVNGTVTIVDTIKDGVATEAEITVTFTADMNSMYKSTSKTFKVSAACTINWPHDNDSWVKDGKIIVSSRTEKNVSFFVNNNTEKVFAATKTVSGDKYVYAIDITAEQIPEGTSIITVCVDNFKTNITVNKDTIAPEFKIDFKSGNEFVKEVTLNLEDISDKGSGVASIKCNNNEVPADLTASEITIPDSMIAEGNYSMTITVTDKAGNKTSKTQLIKKDKTGDAVTVDYDANAWYIPGQEINVTVASGVAPNDNLEVFVKNADNEFVKNTADELIRRIDGTTSYIIDVSKLGLTTGSDNEVKFKSTDKAGNTSETVTKIKYDEDAPTFVIDSDRWYTDPEGFVTVNDIADIGSGVQGIYYLERNMTSRKQAELVDGKCSIPLSDLYFINGKAKLTVIACDIAGNESKQEEVEIKLDSTAPVIENITIAETGTDTASKTANKLTYGLAFREGLIVTADVEDIESELGELKLVATPSNGDPAVEFVIDGPTNGKATFRVNYDAFITDENPEEFAFEGTFQIYAKNGAGIDTAVYVSDGNTGNADVISWENIRPDVDVTMPEGIEVDIAKEDGSKETQIWYSYGFEIPVSLRDSNSGIINYSININGTDISVFNAASASDIIKSKDLKIVIDGVDTESGKLKVQVIDVATGNSTDAYIIIPGDYVYNLKVAATDASGNYTEVSQTFNATASVGNKFNDDTNPIVVIGYEKAASDESAETVAPFVDADGVNWFKDDVRINFNVYDEGDSSGLDNVNVMVNDEELIDSFSWGDIPGVVTGRSFAYDTEVDKTYIYRYYVSATDNNGNAIENGSVEGFVKIDNIQPVVTGISYINAEKSNIFTDIARTLSFGYFFNDKVTIVVEGYDPLAITNMSKEASGIKEYNLYINGELEATSTDGVFVIGEDKIEGRFGQEVSVTIVDNVGNVSEVAVYGEALNVEQNAPVVTDFCITTPAGDVARYPAEPDKLGTEELASTKVWFANDVEYSLTIDDDYSGIASVRIFINGTEVTDYEISDIVTVDNRNSVVIHETLTFGTAGYSALTDGSYTVYYEITDNAGNVTTNMVDNADNRYSYPYTIYMDRTAPRVTNIEFTEDEGSSLDFAYEAYNLENVTLSEDSYLITCDKNIEIKITFTDSTLFNNESSGSDKWVRTPYSGVEDASQVVVTFNDINGKTFTPNAKSYKELQNGIYEWTYVFASDFKGTMKIEITDNVGNKCIDNNPMNFIRESDTLHTEEENHISIKLDKYVDGYYYNHHVTPVIQVKDTYAGIASAVVTVVNNNTVKESHSYSSNAVNKDDYVEDTKDKDHITNIHIPITVNYECDDLLIQVEMVDNAGNASAASYTFTVDTTAPRIEYSLSSSATPNNRYYSAAVTANFTVVEHHFDANKVSITSGGLTGWSNVATDTYTSSSTYSSDGAHQFNITVTDKAGNSTTIGSDGPFYVDNTNPTISVSGIAHDSATNADAVTFTIAAQDNLCLGSSPLTTSFNVWYRENNEKLVNKTLGLQDLVDMNFVTSSVSAGTTLYSYTIDMTKAADVFNDGIYAFSCSATDMSGRTTNTIICQTADGASANVGAFSFSLNRNGSSYQVKWSGNDTEVSTLENVDGKTTNNPTDIVIQEINPSTINTEAAGTKITISDGIQSRIVEAAPTTDSSKMYSIYTYNISKAEYFTSDGTYEIRMETVDNAGNVSDGEGKNFSVATFTVDTTSPVIRTDLDNKLSISEDTHRFSIAIDDISTCIVDIAVTSSDAGLKYALYADAEGTIPLDLSKKEDKELAETVKQLYLDISGVNVEVSVTVSDGINEETSVTYSDIIVTSSRFRTVMAKLEQMPWIYIIIIGVPVAVVAIIILLKKKKHDDFKDEKKAKKDSKKAK